MAKKISVIRIGEKKISVRGQMTIDQAAEHSRLFTRAVRQSVIKLTPNRSTFGQQQEEGH